MRALMGATARLLLLVAATVVVCLPQQLPSNSGQYAARVTTLTGQVSVVRDTGQWALSLGDPVQMQELILSGADGHAIFQVTDGSTFEVFPNSRVVFRKNAGNPRDLIDVILGRVRVIIEHLGLTPNHNRVVTPTAVISVRGTIFDVTVDEDGEESTLVEVEEGIVDVQHKLMPSSRSTALHQGESIRVWRSIPIAKAGFDKPAFFQRALHMVMDAMSTYGSKRPSVGGVGGGTSGGAAGDTGKKIPPPPPPPPPPPKP